MVPWLGLGAFTAKGSVQSLPRGAAPPAKKKKIVVLCLLDFTVLGEKSAIIYIVASIYMASPFSLAAFKVLFLLLIFSSFDCLGPRFYFLIFRGFCI